MTNAWNTRVVNHNSTPTTGYLKGDLVSLSDRGAKVAPRTKFEQWIDGLNDEHRMIVTGWLNDPWYSNARIVQMITADDPEDGFVGYRAHKDTIAVWRKAHNVDRG